MLIITGLSLALAVAMTIIAARLALAERRRSAARVMALAAEIRHDPIADLPPREIAVPGLLAGTTDPPVRSRLAAVIAVGVFVVGSGAALAVVLSGSPSRARPVPAQPLPERPLELVALSQTRDGDRLMVDGVVRNPAGAAAIDGLTAVVFLFDRSGTLVSSTRAPIERTILAAGADSPFRIVVPDAADVARYRVSFRTERGIVAHVDRRAVPNRDER